MIIWTLLDGRIGSDKQTLGLSNSLYGDTIKKNIKYTSLIKLPNFLLGDSLFGVDTKNSDDIFTDLPDLVICSGRRLARVALNIKKRNKGKTKIITILNPNFCFSKFDLVILPKHDNKKGKNVLTFVGTLADMDKNKLADETSKFEQKFANYKRPLVSFVIGGDTKDTKFAPEKMKAIMDLKETLLITTSRRTSDSCIKVLNENLKDNYLYDWKKEEGKDNPYFAMLGTADFLIITGDSISMVAEACSTGKPVYVYMPRESLGKKHYKFATQLIKDGYAREFKEGTILEKYSYEPLNELSKIVKQIKELNVI
ncbi:MAG: mitochondrial fission ELM1 family protein [Rickettsiales bacterium]|nr:MAG: mitochondrial fission ELM1 family protein [Rickettsiales bacterium]